MAELISPVPTDSSAALQRAVSGIFLVETILFDTGPTHAIRFQGRFLTDPAEAYPVVEGRFGNLGYTPLFREEKGQEVIIAVPGMLPEAKPNLRLAVILFALTFVSAAFVQTEWIPGRPLWQNLFSGLLYAVPLMFILITHEMGHYVVTRRLNIPSTLPYFIPLPLPPLGTLGAVIQMKSPPQNRRHLLLLGLAGPLSGLIVALPLLLLGFYLSAVGQVPAVPSYLEGNSILYALLKIVYFGRFLPNCTPGVAQPFLDIVHTALYGCPLGVGQDVLLHPLAFAAWAGILVTGLNLIPAGTLDGGHVAYALLGPRARYLTYGMIVVLLLLGIFTRWWGWLVWGVLILFLGRFPAVPRNDVTRLKAWQVATGIFVLVIFILTFTPVPLWPIQ